MRDGLQLIHDSSRILRCSALIFKCRNVLNRISYWPFVFRNPFGRDWGREQSTFCCERCHVKGILLHTMPVSVHLALNSAFIASEGADCEVVIKTTLGFDFVPTHPRSLCEMLHKLHAHQCCHKAKVASIGWLNVREWHLLLLPAMVREPLQHPQSPRSSARLIPVACILVIQPVWQPTSRNK